MKTPVLLRTKAERAVDDLRRRGIKARATGPTTVQILKAEPDDLPTLRLLVPSLCNLSVQMPLDVHRIRHT